MKKFDFTQCKVSAPRVRYLQANHNRRMTEEQFVHDWQMLRRHSKAKHKGRRNCPSRARAQYRSLKKKFGFFT